jgi:hypothetical protein
MHSQCILAHNNARAAVPHHSRLGGQVCSRSAQSMAEQYVCAAKLTARVRNCTQSLLEYYWRQFPLSRYAVLHSSRVYNMI